MLWFQFIKYGPICSSGTLFALHTLVTDVLSSLYILNYVLVVFAIKCYKGIKGVGVGWWGGVWPFHYRTRHITIPRCPFIQIDCGVANLHCSRLDWTHFITKSICGLTHYWWHHSTREWKWHASTIMYRSSHFMNNFYKLTDVYDGCGYRHILRIAS